MVDGRHVSLRDPHLLGDSILLGKVAEPPGERRIPLEDILAVEAFGPDASGTVQLTLVTLTVAGLGFFVWLFSGPST